MTVTKKWAATAIILLCILGLYAAVKNPKRDSGARDSTPFNRLILADVSGKAQPLSQWQGHRRLINFWAPWCTPCREELPLLNGLYAEWHPQQVDFIGIAMDQPDAVKKFTRQLPLSYPSLIGEDDTLALTRALGNAQQGLPMTLLVGADDHIQWVKLGKLNETDLRAALTRLKDGASH